MDRDELKSSNESTETTYIIDYSRPFRPLDKLGSRLGPPFLGAANFAK